MQSFIDCFKAKETLERPWLVLGKGPSFEKLSQYNLSDFDSMSLNHVIGKVRVTAAHVLDLDVVQ